MKVAKALARVAYELVRHAGVLVRVGWRNAVRRLAGHS